jgi:predicted AlkP superfamily phosphohydrolase/phosphomutase
MVISDHGAGPLKGSLNLNAWLAAEDYLVYKRDRVSPKALGARAVGTLLAIYGRLPARVRSSMKQRMALRREQARELGQYTPVDWSRTRAFAYGRWGSVVINLRGRERHGIVEPGEEYGRVCDEIAARALELRDPGTGQRVVSAVHRREALLHGSELTKMPDLVFELENHEWVAQGGLKRRSPAIWEVPHVAEDGHRILGWHRPEGVIALAGPSVRRHGEIFASLEDIAPTITYLLREPVPSAYEGRVLEEALDPVLLGQRPPVFRDDELADVPAVESYSREEAELVEARLRGLGYLD